MLLLPPLVGNDVSLLPFLKEHVTDAYLGWLNDPEVVRYTEARFTHHTREDAEAYVEACNRPANARLWRIVVDGAHVGNLRLSSIDMYHRRAYVALIIGSKDHRGRGVGTKAINLVAHYGFEELGLHKLCAGVYASNVASIRAFEKAGFVTEAVLKDHHFCEGRFVDGLLMARLAPEGAQVEKHPISD